eukprot:m.214627 g.214627  ORF g.214627 m.214627 type:complete len:436 (+) comp35968_c0_seq1:100-1407(+)
MRALVAVVARWKPIFSSSVVPHFSSHAFSEGRLIHKVELPRTEGHVHLDAGVGDRLGGDAAVQQAAAVLVQACACVVDIAHMLVAPGPLADGRRTHPDTVERVGGVDKFRPVARLDAGHKLGLLGRVALEVERLDEVVVDPVLARGDMVQVEGRREHRVHAGLGGRGHGHVKVGAAALPHIDDRVWQQGHTVVKELLPAQVAGALGLQQIQQLDFVVRLQLGVRAVELRVLRHPRCDLRVALPAGKVHLVAAHMHEFVREERRHLGVQSLHERVGAVQGRVERAELAVRRAARVARREKVGDGEVARAHVAGRVKLGNNADASLIGVLHNLLHIRVRVHVARGKCARAAERGECGRLKGERGVVHKMPVEDVHLVVGHGVQVGLEDAHRVKVARSVDEKAAKAEAREVGNRGGHDVPRAVDQLAEGLEATHGAKD